MYGQGACIGWTPQQVGEMTLDEFGLALSQYAKIQSGKTTGPTMTDEEFDEQLSVLRSMGYKV